jgi:hypothetical protein
VKRWLILVSLTLTAVGCSANPTPTPLAATSAPTAPIVVVTATEEPGATQLASEVPLPTLLPTVTETAGTPTSSTVTSRAAPTAKTTTYKYPAPVPLGPSRPTLYKNGNDITFTYASVGKLLTKECYLVHVDMINPNVATQNNRGDDFLDQDSCGNQGVSGKPSSFVLYRGRFRTSPNYGTILAETLALAPLSPTQLLPVKWYVRVVQNNGLSSDGVHYRVASLSPASAVMDFDFEP